MAKSCTDALSRIKTWAIQVMTYCNRAYAHSADARLHWNAGNDHLAIDDNNLAIEDLATGLSYCNGGWSPYDYEGYLWWYLSNCIEAPTITMDDIINAMLVADPDQIEYFVGIADAYRVAMWDRPFNEEFFRALAEGFKIWP